MNRLIGDLAGAQRGMTLVISLVFLLLLTLLGLSSMQNATLQEKMAGSVKQRNESFQNAETALRLGESQVQPGAYSLPVCASEAFCAPPAESIRVTGAGLSAGSNVRWFKSASSLYGIQNLGQSTLAVNVPAGISATLYRVTGVGLKGNSRMVLESVYAKYRLPLTEKGAGIPIAHRIMWRQIR